MLAPWLKYLHICSERVVYLASDACQIACTGLRLAEAPTVTSTFLSGKPQGVKLPLLLPVNELHLCCLEDGLPLSGGEWLKETSILLLSVTLENLSVFIYDLIHREPVCFILVNRSTNDQLQSAK